MRENTIRISLIEYYIAIGLHARVIHYCNINAYKVRMQNLLLEVSIIDNSMSHE